MVSIPLVTIIGLPTDPSTYNPIKIACDVKVAIASVVRLGLTAEQVSVSIPVEQLKKSRSTEIIVTIVIYDKPDLKTNTLKQMSYNVMKTLKLYHFPDAVVKVMPLLVYPALCSSSAD